MIRSVIGLALYYFSVWTFASGYQGGAAQGSIGEQLENNSLGGLAREAMGPVAILTKVFEDVAIIAGIAFILGAILQYMAHRQNPSQVRLSTPVFMLVLGIALILLPFVGYVTGYNPPMISL